MYLSRLMLNPRSRRVQREIADAYQMHRSLMRAFPDVLDAQDERVLFRLDAQPRTAALTLLVQSLKMPDWSWLAEPGARGYLLPVGEPNPWVKPYEVDLAPGQVFAFRLRANPTVKRDGKRRGLLRQEQQLCWLERKAQSGGFQVLGLNLRREGAVTGLIHRESKSHRLVLLAVRFDGFLRVTDAEALGRTLRSGIGSGKGLGFGLLSLARPPRPSS